MQPPDATQPPDPAQPPTLPDGVSVRLTIPAGEVARAGLVVIGLALGAYILWHIHEVIFLLFLSILLATAIEPFVDRLRRGPFSRGTGVLAVYTAIVLVLAVVLAIIIPSLAAQSDAFVASIPAKIGALRPYAEQLRPHALENAALQVIDRASESVSNPTVAVDEDSLLQIATAIGQSLISFLTVFFLAFYWLVERASIKRVLLRLVPPSRARGVNIVWLEVEQKLGGWVRGQLLVMLAMAVITGIGFWIIGLPNPALLGVLAGLAELVPMVGPFLAVAPAVLVALGISPWTALLVLIFAVVAQQIESNFLVPRIMGHAVGVSPLTVMLGILIGAILYGLPGAFLAVPIAGAIQVIVAHAVGMDDRSPTSIHYAGAAREAAAQAAAGAAAMAESGHEAEAATEATEAALAGTPASRAKTAQRVEEAVLSATPSTPHDTQAPDRLASQPSDASTPVRHG
jgi:predicted PurR-regulated permease PerM